MCCNELSKTVLPNSFNSKDTVKLVLMVRHGQVTNGEAIIRVT